MESLIETPIGPITFALRPPVHHGCLGVTKPTPAGPIMVRWEYVPGDKSCPPGAPDALRRHDRPAVSSGGRVALPTHP
jgi:hypothetical protein